MSVVRLAGAMPRARRRSAFLIALCLSFVALARGAAAEGGLQAPCPAPPATNTLLELAGPGCAWERPQPAPSGALTVEGVLGPPRPPRQPQQKEQQHAGTTRLPVIALPPAAAGEGASGDVQVDPGFSLTLRRLVVDGARLAPPGSGGAAGPPPLWPLGLFEAAPANATLADVRLVVADAELRQWAEFLPGTDAIFHTDNASFVHIGRWLARGEQLHSVTLVAAGACGLDALAAHTQPAAAAVAAEGGCGVRTVDNATLVPTLQRDGAVATARPLLVLVAANVSLGAGLPPGAVPVRRPVVLAGLHSQPTSVDLGMVVNQLNVTEQHARVYWQSLLLENASPGDAVSSIMAPPYSAAVSVNIYAMYCNRSSSVCLNLLNTTTVVASKEEMSYLTFMYSMFNSPLPNMRQYTDFYHTELKVTVLDMGPGPGGSGMLLYNMSCSAWRLVDAVFTNQPVFSVAPRLPFPAGRLLITQATQAAPWVQAVDSCHSLQGAMRTPSSENRLHVWMLLGNVSITQECWRQSNVEHTTQIYGQVQGSGLDAVLARRRTQAEWPAPAPAGAQKPAGGAGRGEEHLNMFSLWFGFLRGALQLPAGAPDKYLQVQNVTLAQLPQGPGARAAAGMRAGQGGSGPAPPDVWTLLLWSVNRTLQGSPLFVSDVQLLLPPPEFDFVAATAQTSSAFVVPLAGSMGLAFDEVSLMGASTVRVGSLQGPGMWGTGMWLLRDPGAAAAMPGGYVWPLDIQVAPANVNAGDGALSSSQTLATKAGVGAAVGSAALLLLLVLGYWCLLRRKQRRAAASQQQPQLQQESPPLKVLANGGFERSGSAGRDGSGRGQPAGQAVEPFLSIDIRPAADTKSVGGGSSGSGSGSGSGSKRQLVAAKRAQRMSPDPIEGRGSSLNSSRSAVRSASTSKQSPSASSDALDNVASGLQRWRAAISSTTLQLMERRMQTQQGSGTAQGAAAGLSASGQGSGMQEAPLAAGSRQLSAASASGDAAAAAAAGGVQLLHVLGEGSFGCVWLGIWHGKRVAVKVMQLPANVLLGPQEEEALLGSDSATASAPTWEERQRRRRSQRLQHNSAPHMAIMEAVVSSTMSHPNVVQVFTYMLNPLTVDAAAEAAGGGSGWQQQQEQAASKAPGSISGWQLKLLMEYCDQGTLREALDRRTLLRSSGAQFPAPSIVLGLAHDVAAALVHLHSEGVVHGDLKAANVMLTRGGEDPGGVWAATVGHRVTAKVADFGLSLPLDPKDTHATMAARGTPTHMSPELFMAGHVSKASDVYAYGVLLFEVITGQRAYAGVPIPLLPHEVARQGLRPTWPANLPPGCRDLQRLAEACWAQRPQDRPSFGEVFAFLEACEHGLPLPQLPPLPSQQASPLPPPLPPLPPTTLQRQRQPHKQRQQQQQDQQQQQPEGCGLQEEARRGLSWSEVSFGGGLQLLPDSDSG